MATLPLPDLHPSWAEPLRDELEKPYLDSIRDFLAAERSLGNIVYPAESDLFRALDLTPLEDVRAVILGQDPYHGPGQAHGLSFSVPPGVRPPPSLVNIFKALQSDLGIEAAGHGCLEHWARQGVLLLNSVLTVRGGNPGSHAGRGWERFTDAVVALVNKRSEPAVFMLWGSHAQKKAAFVDGDRHLVLKAPHPSPLSAHRGFLGCRHFSAANAFLESRGRERIDWALPDCGRPA